MVLVAMIAPEWAIKKFMARHRLHEIYVKSAKIGVLLSCSSCRSRDMALYLVNPGVDLTLELYIAPAMEEAICIQWERVKDRAIRQTFVRKLEKRLEQLMSECMDWDLKEPTPAQASYASLISRKLGVPIPSEALRYRFHMALFIDTYSKQYRLEMSKPHAPNNEDVEKAKTLVAEKLKVGTSSDNNVC